MPSQSPEHPVADLALLERYDRFAPLRNAVSKLSAGIAEWAGVPMPLDGEQLIIEPSYPFAEGLGKRFGQPEAISDDDAKATLRNQFWSTHLQSRVLIGEIDGKIRFCVDPGVHHLDQELRTLGCSDAWGIEQEHRALDLLAGLIKHRAFKQYLLTGAFLESSKRSGVTYMFRKLRPTVAISSRGKNGKNGECLRILCTLCLHPIAYYAGSWAGGMCPTDDVVAHLMLMRADEPMFWRRSNQHPPHVPQAGL